MADSPGTNEWMSPAEVSEEIQIPARTLAQWRYLGNGPRYAKFGKHVRYRRPDLTRWTKSHMVEPRDVR